MSEKLEGELYGTKFSSCSTECFCISMQNALIVMIDGCTDAIIASIVEFRHQSKIGNSVYCNQLHRNIDHYHKMRNFAKRDLEMLKTFRQKRGADIQKD